MSDREERFLRLVSENEGRLRRISRIYADDPASRSDLYQEILVQLWRALPSFRGAASASTWLYRVALNTALGIRRRRRARPEVAFSEGPAEWAHEGPLPDERLESKERLERLYAGIERLDEVDRAVVLLYLDDRSYRQIADVLGISESNVGVKLHRIRKRLAEWLREVGV